MKIIISAILFLVILFSLGSCGIARDIAKIKDAAESVSEAVNEAVSDAMDDAVDSQSYETDIDAEVDFDAIYSGEGDDNQVLSQLSEQEKQQIIADGKLAGIEITFGADGSTTMIYEDGSITVQNADGTWTYKNSEGEIGQLGVVWPDNEYTKLLPEPELLGELTLAASNESYFTASFTGTDTNQMKTFVEKAIEKGFTVNPETYEVTGDGEFYSYTASNADGWVLTATSGSGQHLISLNKPAS
jgi:hypothetical protein